NIIGNNVEARKQINIALKNDPFSLELHLLSALYYYHESRFDESLNECRQVEKLDPNSISIHWRYFHNYFWKGDDLNAVKAIEKIMTMDSMTLKNAAVVKEVYNNSKINGLLRWLIQLELKKPMPVDLTIARLYSLLGKKPEAMFWLGKAWEKRSPRILEINNDPDFENLRREPKFKEIINQLGLSADRYTTFIENYPKKESEMAVKPTF
ncbi:MAG TPA: hypothetical protein VGK38_01665, partial [Prolixibacteraceae bacterium]